MKLTDQERTRFAGTRCVFLDRDGVINRKPAEGRYIGFWDDFEVLPRVERAIAKLNANGYRVIVVSNQRGVALGLYSSGDVETLHEKLLNHLSAYGAVIDGFYFCPHDKGECECRKPDPGLLERAIRDFPDVRPDQSVLIGDSISDIEAARRFGCRSIFIEGDPATRKRGSDEATRLADGTARSLPEAIDIVLRCNGQA